MENSISVIIPAYNAAEYLPGALWGALNQTRAPDEILVIDDGSEDGTAELVQSYGAPVRLISHAHNRGLSAARNTGIREARGRWIALLDADDRWYRRKLQRQAAVLENAGSDLGVVFCLTRIVGVNGDDWIDAGEVPLPQEDPQAFIRALLLKNAVSGSGCSPLIRRDLALHYGGYDEALRTCEDWDLWLKIAGRAGFHRVDEVLCEGFAREGGLSLKLGWLLADADTVLQRHLPRFVPDPDAEARVRRQALRDVEEYAGGLQKGAA